MREELESLRIQQELEKRIKEDTTFNSSQNYENLIDHEDLSYDKNSLFA